MSVGYEPHRPSNAHSYCCPGRAADDCQLLRVNPRLLIRNEALVTLKAVAGKTERRNERDTGKKMVETTVDFKAAEGGSIN